MDSCYAELTAKKITWDEAVLKYSNDELTKQNKGIITNPITGEQTWDMEDLNQVDQQIFVLTDAMEKGDISAPNLYTDIYERKQGVRIVRLMERSQPHRANLNDDYALIKKAAENDKKQNVINDWVKNKISTAFINIDPSFKNCSFKNEWIQK
jgi:peptidyl-prolyl cis-trans isomerase SurA